MPNGIPYRLGSELLTAGNQVPCWPPSRTPLDYQSCIQVSWRAFNYVHRCLHYSLFLIVSRFKYTTYVIAANNFPQIVRFDVRNLHYLGTITVNKRLSRI